VDLSPDWIWLDSMRLIRSAVYIMTVVGPVSYTPFYCWSGAGFLVDVYEGLGESLDPLRSFSSHLDDNYAPL